MALLFGIPRWGFRVFRKEGPDMTHLMRRAGAVAPVSLVIGAVGQARADLITYDIQSYPQYQNGYNVSGTISVDSAYLGTITNGETFALSWSYSIYDSTGALVGAASSTDQPNIGGDLQNGGFLMATTTELILPANTPTNFTLMGTGEWITWRSDGAGGFGFAGELPGQTIWGDYAPPSSFPDGNTGLVIGVASAAPEPSTLAIAGLSGVMLLAYAWCRRRRVAA